MEVGFAGRSFGQNPSTPFFALLNCGKTGCPGGKTVDPGVMRGGDKRSARAGGIGDVVGWRVETNHEPKTAAVTPGESQVTAGAPATPATPATAAAPTAPAEPPAGWRPVPVVPALPPPGQRTIAQEAQVQAEAQTRQRLEAQVRDLARSAGATPAQHDALARQAHAVFRILGGRAVAVSPDGRFLLPSADGASALSVAEWTRAQLTALAGQPGSRVTVPEAPLPPRNPFRKRFWNLTEQMRLQRDDPERARTFREEAWRAGD